MSNLYKVEVPFTEEMGYVGTFIARESTMWSAEQDALAEFNSMREHDFLPPLSKLPAGTIIRPARY